MICFLNTAQDRIEALSGEDLKRLADKYSLKYLMRTSRLDRKLGYKNEKVKIFQLSITQD
jgi:hypothetical protein